MRTGHDEDTNVSDFDCYGKFEPCKRSRYTGYESTRPEGFDGAAQKLSVGRSGDSCWWQPCLETKEDRRRWATDAAWRNRERKAILAVLEEGFYWVRAEIKAKGDKCGRSATLGMASHGGIEPSNWKNSYFVETIADLIQEADETSTPAD